MFKKLKTCPKCGAEVIELRPDGQGTEILLTTNYRPMFYCGRCEWSGFTPTLRRPIREIAEAWEPSSK